MTYASEYIDHLNEILEKIKANEAPVSYTHLTLPTN
jgi:hypothetical protein